MIYKSPKIQKKKNIKKNINKILLLKTLKKES